MPAFAVSGIAGEIVYAPAVTVVGSICWLNVSTIGESELVVGLTTVALSIGEMFFSAIDDAVVKPTDITVVLVNVEIGLDVHGGPSPPGQSLIVAPPMSV